MDTSPGTPKRLDPRSERSAGTLRRAVLQLAAQLPSNKISVTDLVKLAGVSRKTFYNHAATPADLLNRALLAELDDARDLAEREFAMASDDLVGAVRNRLRAILQHVYDRRLIYTHGDNGTLPPELYQLLSDHFRVAVRQSIVDAHRIPPAVPGFDDEAHRAAAVEMYASYVAGAYAGSIQAWLARPDAGEVDFVLNLILAALPDWMVSR